MKRGWSWWGTVLCLGVGLPLSVLAQEAPQTCEQQVSTVWKDLLDAKVILEPGAPVTGWEQQLQLLATELRVQKTDNELTTTRAANLQHSIAQLLDQLRRLQQKEAAK